MELVLNDEVGRPDRADVPDPWSTAGRRAPGGCRCNSPPATAGRDADILSSRARTGSAFRRATPSSRTCRRSRSSWSADGGKSPRRPREPAGRDGDSCSICLWRRRNDPSCRRSRFSCAARSCRPRCHACRKPPSRTTGSSSTAPATQRPHRTCLDRGYAGWPRGCRRSCRA